MDQVDEVKSKVDIIEVISSYLPLRKTGRNFAGLCPFHSEKTPSFMVSGERQVFRCFGCGESGDVFTFLSKIEGWDFREALLEVASRVGVKLTSYAPSQKSKSKDKILELLALVAKFYSHLLMKHPAGKRAREYLSRRGIRPATWEKFGLGFAPSGWELTSDFLKKRGWDFADMSAAGLVVARQEGKSGRQGFYDRFRGRLIFPLKDARGAILGFSARIIDESRIKNQESRSEPKYINSPQTEVFSKGSVLFGLDVAREAIREKNEAILVEGEFDVLSAYQAGFSNSVASKGTALTDKQVAILSRACENVILCFDTDLAGDVASWRGIELMDMAGVNVRVARLGKYKDPDEFCQKDPGGFAKAVAGAANVYDYFIDSACVRYDPGIAEGKKKIGKVIIPVLSKITDDLVRAHYIEKLAKILGLDVLLVASAVEKKLNLEAGQTPSNSFSEPRVSKEEYFLALFLYFGEINPDFLELLDASDFEKEEARLFWSWIGDIIENSKKKAGTRRSKNLSSLLSGLPKELVGFVDSLYLVDISPVFSDRELLTREIVKIARMIKTSSLKRELGRISEKLKEAEKDSDKEKILKLTKKFGELSKAVVKELKDA